MTVEDRRAAFLAGQRAETAAALWLRLKGFRILSRRYKCPVGEIDLVARRGALLLFVEVKARKTETEARHAITPHQRRRIERAAMHFLKTYPGGQRMIQRFDAILMVPGKLPIHISDAWR